MYLPSDGLNRLMAQSHMYNGKSAILSQAPSTSTLGTSKAVCFEKSGKEEVMKKYMIEREIPQVGTLEGEKLRQAAAKSNQVLRELGPDIQWSESFLAADRMFCVYLAEDESLIHRHAELSGFPATKVTEIGKTIDPTTGAQR
jgi:hypothetical protein